MHAFNRCNASASIVRSVRPQSGRSLHAENNDGYEIGINTARTISANSRVVKLKGGFLNFYLASPEICVAEKAQSSYLASFSLIFFSVATALDTLEWSQWRQFCRGCFFDSPLEIRLSHMTVILAGPSPQLAQTTNMSITVKSRKRNTPYLCAIVLCL